MKQQRIMNTPAPHLIWFRQDLRLFDNTAFMACCQLASAAQSGVLAVVYLTPTQWQQHHKSLWQIDLMLRQIQSLKQSLQSLNIGLIIRTTPTFNEQIADLLTLCNQQSICHVFANREYLLNEIQRDQQFAHRAQSAHIHTHWYDDSTIVPPKHIVTDSGQAYKVFTPFYKRWTSTLANQPIMLPPEPAALSINTSDIAQQLSHQAALNIHDFYQRFYQPSPNWQQQLQHVSHHGESYYPAGEHIARQQLKNFVQHDITHYDTARDIPSLKHHQGATSRLSPYLAVGIISARECYQHAIQQLNINQGIGDKDIQRWISELAWRDFYADVMFNRLDMVKGAAFLPLDSAIAWRYDPHDFQAWCIGKTGVPLVDAAMRCLNATGWMHNRLRMVVAMYLTKNLLIDWRWGEQYFIRQLVDGDFASNNGGWQWSASVGTDAQPYFRVMNPFSQAQSHDSEAQFIKHWLPELRPLPASIINQETKLQSYLQQHPQLNYPTLTQPTKQSRLRAIETFQVARIVS